MNKLQKTFNDIVERTRAKSIGTADSFSGLCPAHDDRSASLSITLKNNRILLYCHAGCNIDDICVSLGMEKSDLFAPIDEKQINRVPVPQKVEREQIRMKANINFEGKVVFFQANITRKLLNLSATPTQMLMEKRHTMLYVQTQRTFAP